jgi:hypothetical protein
MTMEKSLDGSFFFSSSTCLEKSASLAPAGRLGLEDVARAAEVCRERCARFVSGQIVNTTASTTTKPKKPAILFLLTSIEFS